MTDSELRELDAWIAFRVTKETVGLVQIRDPDISFLSHYTTSPAAAMEVLKKCAEKVDQISITVCGTWAVCEGDGNNKDAIEAEAKTLELAICLFAKVLFENEKGKK